MICRERPAIGTIWRSETAGVQSGETNATFDCMGTVVCSLRILALDPESGRSAQVGPVLSRARYEICGRTGRRGRCHNRFPAGSLAQRAGILPEYVCSIRQI
jgi:hypothetical protein